MMRFIFKIGSFAFMVLLFLNPERLSAAGVSELSETEFYSHSQLPQHFTCYKPERRNGQLENITDVLLKQNKLLLHSDENYTVWEIDDMPDSDSLYYRFAQFERFWNRWSNGYIKSAGLTEGRYRLEISHLDSQNQYQLLYTIPVEVKGGVFYGLRGYVLIFLISSVLVALFLWLRSLFLRRDRSRTVRFLENTVQRRTNQLQELLDQRELLLKEIHHRVKNNLQVISALLEMQGARTEDPNVKAAILEGQNRVLSIAFIHQNLYQHDDLKGVEIGSFLKELTMHVRQVFEKPDCPVEVKSKVPPIYLDIDSAIPLGLIINELLTNSFKYAFKGRPTGTIDIEIIDLNEGNFHFRYFDNGVGLPENFDFTKSNSLGMKLIRQLSRQLAGNIIYTYQDGSSFELNFKNMEARSKMI